MLQRCSIGGGGVTIEPDFQLNGLPAGKVGRGQGVMTFVVAWTDVIKFSFSQSTPDRMALNKKRLLAICGTSCIYQDYLSNNQPSLYSFFAHCEMSSMFFRPNWNATLPSKASRKQANLEKKKKNHVCVAQPRNEELTGLFLSFSAFPQDPVGNKKHTKTAYFVKQCNLSSDTCEDIYFSRDNKLSSRGAALPSFPKNSIHLGREYIYIYLSIYRYIYRTYGIRLWKTKEPKELLWVEVKLYISEQCANNATMCHNLDKWKF